jgi:hypothetical protein
LEKTFLKLNEIEDEKPLKNFNTYILKHFI